MVVGAAGKGNSIAEHNTGQKNSELGKVPGAF